MSQTRDHGPGTIATHMVDGFLLRWLREAAQLEATPEDPSTSEAKLDSVRLAREVTAVDAQVIGLTRQLAAGLVPERAYKATVDDLEKSRRALIESLAAAERAVVLKPEDPAGKAASLLEQWDFRSLPAKRAAIRELVASIEIDYGEQRTMTITPRGGVPVVSVV